MAQQQADIMIYLLYLYRVHIKLLRIEAKVIHLFQSGLLMWVAIVTGYYKAVGRDTEGRGLATLQYVEGKDLLYPQN